MRIDVDGRTRRHDVADHAGLAGGEPARARVRAVAVPLGGVGDTPARLLADLRIAVQRAAHRGLRQGQHVGQLLEVHPSAPKCQSAFKFRSHAMPSCSLPEKTTPILTAKSRHEKQKLSRIGRKLCCGAAFRRRF